MEEKVKEREETGGKVKMTASSHWVWLQLVGGGKKKRRNLWGNWEYFPFSFFSFRLFCPSFYPLTIFSYSLYWLFFLSFLPSFLSIFLSIFSFPNFLYTLFLTFHLSFFPYLLIHFPYPFVSTLLSFPIFCFFLSALFHFSVHTLIPFPFRTYFLLAFCKQDTSSSQYHNKGQ